MDRVGEKRLATAVTSHDQAPQNSTLIFLLDRISTLLKQRNFQDALDECETALQTFGDHEKLQEKKIKILCHQGRFDEGFEYAKKWARSEPKSKTAQKELKRLKIVIQALKDQDSDDNESKENDSDDLGVDVMSNDGMSTDKPRSEDSSTKHIQGSHHLSSITVSSDTASSSSNTEDQDHCCTFCDIKFSSVAELETHCRSDLHKKRITSDDDQNWQYRIPPRNLTSEEFTLCRSFADNGKCNFGDKCTQAHSKEELNEWKERFKFRKQQIKIARDKHLHGNTYAEQLMEKLINAENSKSVMTQNVEYAKIHVNSELKVNMTTKKCTNAWTFTITSKRSLHRVTLLDDTNRTYFYIASISVGPKKTQKYQNLETHCQEWVNPDYTTRHVGEYVYRVKVVFKTDIYGTFRQTLVYDFGLEPVLSREVQIESAPITDVEKLSKDLILNEQGRWRPENVQLIEYASRPVPIIEEEKTLLKKYCLPEAEKFRLGEHLMHPPSKETYRIWMHEMLYIEEWAQLEHISRFNVKTSLQLVNKFLLVPGAVTGAKYAQSGELFARMQLHDDLSEDSPGGRLILQSSNIAWLAPFNPDDKHDSKQIRKVYEVLVEDKGKNFIFLRLSGKCVEELNLSSDQEFYAEIQFQLNRLPKCEQHAAVDKLPTLDLMFPPTQPTEPWWSDENVQFSEMVSTRLNMKQKEAIQGITAQQDLSLPPILLIGPYGTGKTYTLAQAAMQALANDEARILICTHSNSAADIYIKDFLHPMVKEGHFEARPLRIYYRHRWVQTVPDVVLQYCLREMSVSDFNFRMPTMEDVEKHRIIITTLSTARYLCDLDLPQGFFSHIFVDEAAQAMESETLIPLSLAGKTTKIVLCGDHMQLNPEVYSDFAKQQGFHKNLLDRLYEFYPDNCPCKIMLCENYRSHAAIIDFTSDLFYDSQLVSGSSQPLHPMYYPLTFFSTRGEDIQHQNNTGFYNIAEVHEVVDRVDDLQKNWPPEWGEIDGNIGVFAPYSDQVVRIRGELRKRKLFHVSVERVFNVQGKQFRAIILSTVRTRHTCSADSSQEDFVDYGFLSNVKLLNTALTRAQSLVIVVGDPLSLCLVGKCRKVWEYFLEICNEHKSLYGMKQSVLRAQLNSAELRKTYVLNPLAPEFVPNRLYHVTHSMGLPGQGLQNPQQQAGYFLGQRMMYPGNPYQQMYPSYMPVPYHQGYYPPMLYRPYVPHFVGGRGGRVPTRVVYPRQMSPAVPLATSGRATPDKERSSPEVTRATESPQSQGTKKTHVSQRSRQMVYIPRVQTPFQTMYYNPYHQPYPGYYLLPEDPRLAPSLHPPRYPYYPGAGIHPAHMLSQHYSGTPFVPATAVLRPGQPLQEGTPIQGDGDVKERVHSNSSSPSPQGRAYSPSVSPGSTIGGQHIQLLPNARHIPVHLYNRSGTPSSGSRSSTPMGGRDSPEQMEDVRRVLESDYLKSVSPALDMQERRASAQSPLARVITQRQGYVREDNIPQAVSQASMSSSIQYNASMIVSEESMSPVHNGERSDGASSMRRKDGRRMPAKLDIPTGFSRQFSEDIETPTEITNLVRMIDETIDEQAELGMRDQMTPENQNSFASRLSSKSSSGKLYLNIPKRSSMDTSGGSASSSSPSASPTGSDDRKPTYAGVLRRRLPTSSEEIDASMLEPQTPHTPAGFVSPNDDIDTDPLGILRNLNINASAENQRTYKYFS